MKRLKIVATDFYEVELVKFTSEYREPIIVYFLILHYAELRMWSCIIIFFDKTCDVNNFEDLEMDTDFFCLALTEENFYDCIFRGKRAE